MRVQQLMLRGAGGVAAPRKIALADGLNDIVVEADVVPYIPLALLTLFYPGESRPEEIRALAAGDRKAQWGFTATIGPRTFRVLRRPDPESVTLELFHDESQSWRVVDKGAATVQKRLNKVLKLPDRAVVRALQLGILDEPSDNGVAATSTIGGASGFDVGLSGMLMGNEDYFGDSSPLGTALDSEQKALLVDAYRRAKVAEERRRRVDDLEERAQRLGGRMSAMVDESGGLEAARDELRTLPALRELTAEEKEILTEPQQRDIDFERRIEELESESAATDVSAESARAPVELLRDPLLLSGAALTLVATIYSLVGGDGARKFALANVFFLALVVAAVIRYLSELEEYGVGARRLGAMERRLAALRNERAEWKRAYDALVDELGVQDVETWERTRTRRAELEEKVDSLEREHAATTTMPQYQKLQRELSAVEEELEIAQRAYRAADPPPETVAELARELRGADIDPSTISVDVEGTSTGDPFAQLAAVAKTTSLIGPDGMDDEFERLWGRLNERIAGASPPLRLTLEGVLEVGDSAATWQDLDQETRSVLRESLSLALLLRLVKKIDPPPPALLVRCRPFAEMNERTAGAARGLYESLAERLQIICVHAEEV